MLFLIQIIQVLTENGFAFIPFHPRGIYHMTWSCHPLCGKTSDTIYDLYTQGHIPFLTCHSKPPTIWPQHNFLKSCPTRSHHVSALSPNWTNHMLNKHICFLPSGTLLMLQLGILSSPLITTPHPRSCCCSVTQLPLTLCDPVDCNTPGCPVFHHLPEFAQTHVHWVSDAIQPSHPPTRYWFLY